jgi:molecular chaperone HtpG
VLCHITYDFYSLSVLGIDEDDSVPESTPATDDMPPLEGDEDDASRMEEVD